MVKMLRKSGVWTDMMEEMKVRVLKVATEKYREKKRASLEIGKFEFCNNLYITLAEVIYNTLKELMAKRRIFKESNDISSNERLRKLADEYEASEDYISADRCHQERLVGENMRCPDIWFEYGCLCMRMRPKEQGKAEECFREALHSDKNHLPSLQALGCLMWHRGYLTQAEVLMRSAINLHGNEEHMCWLLVSKVYAAQGKTDSERASLRRAEDLYLRYRERFGNPYSLPHQLLNPIFKFPFSLAYQALTTRKTSSLYLDSAMLLLDLHLPMEAEEILKLDSDIYSCTLDNKWCRATTHALKGELEKAEAFMKEAVAIDKDNSTTWLLLGHLRFSFKAPFKLPEALQISLCKEAIDAYTKYKRYVKNKDNLYEFVYHELGFAYCKLGEWDQARRIFLKACTVRPTSSISWLAAGMAYYYMGDLKHAELALVEGNVLDMQNFKIWAYLTLVCLQMGREDEAEMSFQQGLKTSLDPNLLVTIAEGFCNVGNYRDAETAFIQSLKVRESASVRFKRAEMFYKLGKFPAAKGDYERVVKLPDVTQEDQAVCISRLTELQDVEENPPINRFPDPKQPYENEV